MTYCRTLDDVIAAAQPTPQHRTLRSPRTKPTSPPRS
jgi:hypothetical protein